MGKIKNLLDVITRNEKSCRSILKSAKIQTAWQRTSALIDPADFLCQGKNCKWPVSYPAKNILQSKHILLSLVKNRLNSGHEDTRKPYHMIWTNHTKILSYLILHTVLCVILMCPSGLFTKLSLLTFYQTTMLLCYHRLG